MTVDHSPSVVSHTSSNTSDSVDERPATPKLPFIPPRRRSSLAFSKVLATPITNCDGENMNTALSTPADQPTGLCPGIGRKRTVEIPHRYSGASPGHVAQIQRVFQTARANLHLDMHFAASPSGSIDSRLPQSAFDQAGKHDLGELPGRLEKTWRYSGIPSIFPKIVQDVREPLPDSSPTLPAVALHQTDIDFAPIEPTSSGFASPLDQTIPSCEDQNSLPPLPRPSPAYIVSKYDGLETASDWPINNSEDVLDLTQPMTGLKVCSDPVPNGEQPDDKMDNSPIIDHLRRKSGADSGTVLVMPDLPDSIFLSHSAKAAAESAKAKRDLLRQAFEATGRAGRLHYNGRCPDPAAHQSPKSTCPDPSLHNRLANTPYPNPFAHVQNRTMEVYPVPFDVAKIQPPPWDNQFFASRGVDTTNHMPIPNTRRTTATGSPMPFAKRALSPLMDINDIQTYHSYTASSPPPKLRGQNPIYDAPASRHHSQRQSEHFRPGWHYSSTSTNRHTHPSTDYYSFSTAAAKVTGESVAPDSRIRDSYRTDTLTPLARPPGRYRKNGIGATLQSPSPLRRRHGHSVPPRLVNSRLPSRQNNKPMLPHPQPRYIRSSPPRPVGRDVVNYSMKRKGDDYSMTSDFDIASDSSTGSLRFPLRSQHSEDVMSIDEETRDAIRVSLYGPNTPECLHGEREGIRELSPNVNMWRKGMPGGPHYRKKRRPSYWDGDLKEVKMSPAGRGGIASSPIISKQSMAAEFETGSMRTDVIATNENIVEDYSCNERNREAAEADMINPVEMEG